MMNPGHYAGRVVKIAGLVPALSEILAHLLNLDFLKEWDPLVGYGGTSVHAWALVICAVAWLAAGRVYAKWPTMTASGAAISAVLAFAFLALTLLLAWVHLPQSYVGLGDARWPAAVVTYLLFYTSLGVAFAR